MCGPDAWIFWRKVGIWTCPDLPRPVQEDKSLSVGLVFLFFFLQKLPHPFVWPMFMMFNQNLSSSDQIYDLFMCFLNKHMYELLNTRLCFLNIKKEFLTAKIDLYEFPKFTPFMFISNCMSSGQKILFLKRNRASIHLICVFVQ